MDKYQILSRRSFFGRPLNFALHSAVLLLIASRVTPQIGRYFHTANQNLLLLCIFVLLSVITIKFRFPKYSEGTRAFCLRKDSIPLYYLQIKNGEPFLILGKTLISQLLRDFKKNIIEWPILSFEKPFQVTIGHWEIEVNFERLFDQNGGSFKDFLKKYGFDCPKDYSTYATRRLIACYFNTVNSFGKDQAEEAEQALNRFLGCLNEGFKCIGYRATSAKLIGYIPTKTE